MDVATSPAPSPVERSPRDLTYAVATIPVPGPSHFGQWKPKGPLTHFPATHPNLPYGIAVELCEFLNGLNEIPGRGKISFVSRRLSNRGTRFDVLTVPGTFDPLQGKDVLLGCSLQGAPLAAAIDAARRINSEIVRLAAVPKVWAVVIAEGPRKGVQS